MHRIRSHPRWSALGVAVALLTALLAIGGMTAASASGFTLDSLNATVGSGGSVTATTSVTSSVNVTAGYYGVCVRSSSGSNLDYGKRTNVAFVAGVAQDFSGTRTFANGTYSYFACVYANSTWSTVGSSKSFTVGSTPPPTSTPPSSSSSSSSPPPSSSSSSPPPSGTAPNGPSGSWSLTFDDEFNGTSLDTSKWSPNWYGEGGTMNGVPTYARNVSEHDGAVWLQLEGSGSTPSAGAAIETDHSGGARLAVGQYAEARVYLPGPSSTALSNWGGWWTTSTAADGWASSGEHDIEETLSGQATNNYHYGLYPNVTADNHGGVSGFQPGNSWHTYGIYRATDHADIYWDGVKVKSYTTHDNGKPEILVFNVGNGSNDGYGAAGAERVDYARVWQPAA